MPASEKTRAHANCCPPMGEEVFGSRLDASHTIKSKIRKTLREETVHFDLKDLTTAKIPTNFHYQRIYNVPNEVLEPEISPEEIRQKRQKKLHVIDEIKTAAKIRERKIRGLSDIYKLPVPIYTGKYYTPEYDSGYYPSWQKAESEDNRRNCDAKYLTTCKSATYTEFVGKISYLVEQSRKKMVLYSDDPDMSIKRSQIYSKTVSEPPIIKPSPKQSVFGKKQISIAGAVRKLLAIDEAKGQ